VKNLCYRCGETDRVKSQFEVAADYHQQKRTQVFMIS